MTKNIEIEGAVYWSDWLHQWRYWLLGALIGTLAALALYTINPPDFRAQATVLVDQNAEEAWIYYPDRQLFQFLNRESNRLLALAWSDEVLAPLVDLTSGLALQELREDHLDLSHPADGAWHFMASHPDPVIAGELAHQWSQSFLAEIQLSIDASPELIAAREALELKLAQDPDPEDPELIALLAELMTRAEESRGISPFVEVYLSQAAATPLTRAPSQPTYLVVGALFGLILALILSLLKSSSLKKAQ